MVLPETVARSPMVKPPIGILLIRPGSKNNRRCDHPAETKGSGHNHCWLVFQPAVLAQIGPASPCDRRFPRGWPFAIPAAKPAFGQIVPPEARLHGCRYPGPGKAPSHQFHCQGIVLQIGSVYVGYLQLSARRRFELSGDFHHIIVVKVQTRHGIVRLWFGRFFFDADGTPRFVEGDHAITLRVRNMIAEDGCAFWARGGTLQHRCQPMSKKQIVAQNQGHAIIANEIAANDKGLRQTLGPRLGGISQIDAKAGPIAHEAMELFLVLWSGDDKNISYSRQHQRRQRIIDHRLVINRHELFTHGQGQGIKAGAVSSGKDDPFHGRSSFLVLSTVEVGCFPITNGMVMRVWFIHQNFPGQFRHIALALCTRKDCEVIATGDVATAARSGVPDGLRLMHYATPQGAGATTHHYLRGAESAIRRGQAVARLALTLDKQGLKPDIIYCHPGWGEGLFLKDVWPDVPVIGYCEFYYDAKGQDVGFDPEFPTDFDDRFRLRIKNTTGLLSLETLDLGISPTKWQRSTFPARYHDMIDTIFDGVDTNYFRPDAADAFTLPDGRVLDRKDEVVTFATRSLEPYRGIHSFVRAIPALQKARPDAHIVIAGGQDARYGRKLPQGETYLKRYLKEAGDRIDHERLHIVGKLPFEAYRNLLCVSRVHVYLTYPFVLSWSLIEAMSVGGAIVASRTAPVEEVITDGITGVLTDFFDPEGIARAVTELCGDEQKRRMMSLEARKAVVEKYDLMSVCLPQQINALEALWSKRVLS